jgi:hypothetical protein
MYMPFETGWPQTIQPIALNPMSLFFVSPNLCLNANDYVCRGQRNKKTESADE